MLNAVVLRLKLCCVCSLRRRRKKWRKKLKKISRKRRRRQNEVVYPHLWQCCTIWVYSGAKRWRRENYKHILYKHFWNTEILRVICVAFCKKDPQKKWIFYVLHVSIRTVWWLFPHLNFLRGVHHSTLPSHCDATRTTPSSLCCTHPSVSMLACFVC